MPKLVSLEQLDIHYNETKKIFATKRELPTKVSELQNDKNYLSKDTTDYTSLVNLKTSKQDNLIAGENITINGATISATSDVTKAYVDEQIAEQSSENVKQNDEINLLKRKVSAQEQINKDIAYRFETDDTEAYQKVIRSGAKAFDLKMLGGKSVVWNVYNASSYRMGTVNGLTFSQDGALKSCSVKGTCTRSDNYTAVTVYNLVVGHKYYIRLYFKNLNTEIYNVSYGTDITKSKTDIVFTSNNVSSSVTLKFEADTTYDGEYYARIIDLTVLDSNKDYTLEMCREEFPAELEITSPTIVSASVGNVKVQGKNLFNGVFQNGTISNSTGLNSGSSSTYRTDFIEVLPSTQYKLSVKNTTGVIYYYLYDEQKQYINDGNTEGHYTKGSAIVNTPSNAKYIRFRTGTGWSSSPTEGYYWLCFNNGNTEYTPYREPQNITIPNECTDLKSAGDVHDTIEMYEENGKKYIKKIQRLGSVVVDGVTKKLSLSAAVNPNGTIAYSQSLGFTRDTAHGNVVSNRFIKNTSSNTSMPLYSFYGGNGVPQTIWFIVPSTLTTADEINAWVQANPIVIYYALETPIETIIEIDNRFDSILCEANGTITFEGSNENYHLPVPNEEEFMVKLSEV